MQSIALYVDDPFLQFCWSLPTLSALEQRIIWTINKLSAINARLSFSGLARAAQVSRRSVVNVVRKFRGRGLLVIGEIGRAGIVRVDLPCLRRDSPGQTVPTSVHELPRQPGQTVPTPPPGNVSLLPEGILKAFKLKDLRIKREGADETRPTPRSQISSAGKAGLSAEEKSDLEALVQFHADVLGLKISNPPVLPAGHLYFSLVDCLSRIGREANLDAILAHIEEEKQGKKSEKELLSSRFIKLEYIFRGEKINGKTTPGSVDMYRISELAARGRAIREQRERRAAPPPPAPIVRAEPEARRDPAVAGRWLEHLLGRRTRISATN